MLTRQDLQFKKKKIRSVLKQSWTRIKWNGLMIVNLGMLNFEVEKTKWHT